MKESDDKISSNAISELSQKIFERVNAHSSTFNEAHNSYSLVEVAVDHAWSYLSNRDDEVNDFIRGMKHDLHDKEEEFVVLPEEFDQINSMSEKIFVDFVAFKLQGMNNDSVGELIRESIVDSCLFVFTNRHIMQKLQEAQDERQDKMEKEIKRFEKYGTLKLVKNNENRKDSKKT